MLKTIFILSLSFNLLFADLTIYKEFNVAQGSIEMDKEKIIVTIGNKTIKLDTPSDYKEIFDLTRFIDKANLITIKDYNFDGYNDISVVTGVGYGGVNIFADYYFYDPVKNTYHKYLQEVSNLEVKYDKLVSYTKTGARYVETEYQVHNKKPYLSLKKEMVFENLSLIKEYNQKGKEIKAYSEPRNMKIVKDKVYFYTKPLENKKSKGYVIKGDKVEVLDTTEDYSWLKIRYKNKKNSFIRWIKSESI